MRENHEVVWYNCLQVVKDILPEVAFTTWFKPIVPLKLEHNVLTLQVPNMFFYEYLEEHFIDLLKKVIRKELGSEAKLEYSIAFRSATSGKKSNDLRFPGGENGKPSTQIVDDMPLTDGKHVHPDLIPGLSKRRVDIDPNLMPEKNFENFIEGRCNEVARSVGSAVAKNPGKTSFNPMFIYGESSLGKTHLAQAIGLDIKKNFGDKKIVLYVSAQQFQTQYSEAARKNNRNEFTRFYELVDVLIIDDVQDFAGKPGTQDAFFHLFNHLHQSGKQLILTCDRPPSELKGVNKRLISRFKWAMTAELTAPDYETRLAILKRKAYNNGKALDDKILQYIAENVRGNIRELEGVLVSITAFAMISREEISFELAKQKVDQFVRKPKMEVSIKTIVKVVSDYFGFQAEALLSQSRKREIVQARQIAMYCAKKFTNAPLTEIGTEIGTKNHATVLYSFKTVSNLIETDRTFKTYLDEIEKRIYTVS